MNKIFKGQKFIGKSKKQTKTIGNFFAKNSFKHKFQNSWFLYIEEYIVNII